MPVYNFSSAPAKLREEVFQQPSEKWLQAKGGVAGIERVNVAKAALRYDAIDRSGFYSSRIAKRDRSRINVLFSLADTSRDPLFLQQAAERGLVQLKRHRPVGGMRASIYNAVPLEGVQALVDFMVDFGRRHG